MRVGTHSFVSFIVLVVFCIVSFVFISLIVIMSLRTVLATMMVSGMHNVWMMQVAREQWDMASAFALRLRARWLSSGPADSQPVASDTRNHMMLLCVCKCMLMSACARRWRGSHACSVRVERAVHACARVQGAEQRDVMSVRTLLCALALLFANAFANFSHIEM